MSEVVSGTSIPRFDYGRFEVPSHLTMNMHFAPHNTAGDLPSDLNNIVRNTDVVVVETVGAIKDIELEVLSGLTNNDRAAIRESERWIQLSQNPAWKRLFYTALKGSGVAVSIPDLAHGDPILDQYDQITQYITNASIHPDYATSAFAVAQALPIKLGLRKQRDQRVLENMTSDIGKLSRTSASATAVTSFYGGEHHLFADALAHGAQHDPTVAITKDMSLAPLTMMTDLYDKYMTGVAIGGTDKVRYNLEQVLLLADQLAGKHETTGDEPTKTAMDLIYAKVATLSIKEARDLRKQTVEHVRSVIQ